MKFLKLLKFSLEPMLKPVCRECMSYELYFIRTLHFSLHIKIKLILPKVLLYIYLHAIEYTNRKKVHNLSRCRSYIGIVLLVLLFVT